MAEYPITAQILAEGERRHRLSMENGSSALLTALQTKHPRIVAKLQRAAIIKQEQSK
jgi:hypothetical protein